MKQLPIVMDIEASGFGRGSYPIEIGVAFSDGGCDCMLVRPQPDWTHWDSEAESLHGLRREILLAHGHAPQLIARRLNKALAGKVVYCDAWGNDSSWLALLFEVAETPQLFRVESVIALLSPEQIDRWSTVKKMVIASSHFRRHRASNDACLIQETLRQLGVACPADASQVIPSATRGR